MTEPPIDETGHKGDDQTRFAKSLLWSFNEGWDACIELTIKQLDMTQAGPHSLREWLKSQRKGR